jgi:hypothetical protein
MSDLTKIITELASTVSTVAARLTDMEARGPPPSSSLSFTATNLPGLSYGLPGYGSTPSIYTTSNLISTSTSPTPTLHPSHTLNSTTPPLSIH